MKNILYIDDEPINLELFKVNFKNDYNVFTGLSAKEGFEILKTENINVIVSDLKMPEINGYEFIKMIKHDTPEKICILLTAYMEPDIMMHAINSKTVYKYMLKPWKKKELQAIIEDAFSLVPPKN